MRNAIIVASFAVLGMCVVPNLVASSGLNAQAPIRVLFIGNSFTYVNDLPELVDGFARGSKGAARVETRMVAAGGATLESTWRDGKALAVLRGSRWDYVVLQEQSSLGSLFINGRSAVNDPSRIFYPAVRKFGGEARRAGAKTILMLTWAPRAEPGLQDALTYAYMAIGREIGAAVAPVGIAWASARRDRPSVDLFDPAPWDGLHPSPAGSYLAAAVLFATITGRSPIGAPAVLRGHPAPDGRVDSSKSVTLVSLPLGQAKWLQEVAWRTRLSLEGSGGYVSLPRPAPAERPRMPAGAAPDSTALIGHWIGKLNLYYQSPATIELTFRRDRSRLCGTLRLIPENFGDPESFELSNVVVRDGQLTFTVPNKRYEHGDVTYRAVATDQGLEGIAQFSNPALDAIAIGTWSARRAR